MPIIKRVKPNIFKTNGIRFIPGNNTISDEQLEMLMEKSESFCNQIDNGVMVLVDTKKSASITETLKKEKDSKKAGDELSDIREILESSIKDATPLIEELYDVPSLEKILENDNRAGIHKLVNAQLEEIRAEDENEEDED